MMNISVIIIININIINMISVSLGKCFIHNHEDQKLRCCARVLASDNEVPCLEEAGQLCVNVYLSGHGGGLYNLICLF